MLVHSTELPHFSKESKEGKKRRSEEGTNMNSKETGKENGWTWAKKVKDRVAQHMFASLALTSNRARQIWEVEKELSGLTQTF